MHRLPELAGKQSYPTHQNAHLWDQVCLLRPCQQPGAWHFHSYVDARYCRRGIVSNIAFIGYAIMIRMAPILILQSLLLPMNISRIVQIWQLTGGTVAS